MKNYEELKFTDDFMFCKILSSDLKLCRELLELVLNIKIKKLAPPVSQKTVDYAYGSHGIRLDVYIDDEKGTVYDLEIQTSKLSLIPKRSRYYQSMIDIDILSHGQQYDRLKKSFIIFFCTDDPFEKHLPIYTFENRCIQNPSIRLGDDAIKVVVNPKSDRTGLSDEMSSFLDLLEGKNNLQGLAMDLSNAVDNAIVQEQWRVEYMTFADKLREEREDGILEGIERGREEGLKEGREEGLEQGREEGRLLAILDGVRDGDYSIERAAEKLGLSVDDVRKLMSEISSDK